MRREGQCLHHRSVMVIGILVLTLMNDFRYLLKYCNCVNFFYLEIKLFYLYVNKTNCVQDEEFIIIEENGRIKQEEISFISS